MASSVLRRMPDYTGMALRFVKADREILVKGTIPGRFLKYD